MLWKDRGSINRLQAILENLVSSMVILLHEEWLIVC